MASDSFKINRAVATNGHVDGHDHGVRRATDDVFVGLLNEVHARLTGEFDNHQLVSDTLDELFVALRGRREHTSPQEWRDFIHLCRQHPLLGVLHQDPFTFRAYSKPRGYAGDAPMMDYIYGREEMWPPPECSIIGARIFDYTTAAPASVSVRARRAFVAAAIDRLAESTSRPDVLAIAAGHLREVSLSAAIRRRRVGRMVALDADARSMAEVNRAYGKFGVEVVPAGFRKLVGNKLDLGSFDLVYSTGLFDYLEQSIAVRLATSMFRLLRPGGSLVVANFLPGVRDVGYMEAFMDWNLVYRGRRDMVDLTTDLADDEIDELRVVSEECHNIVFLQVVKAR